MTDRLRLRRGTTMIELVVAAGLLTTTISFVTVMTFRTVATWKQTTHARLALDELSNQLDRLTHLPVDEAERQCESIAVSETVAPSLPGASLTGQWIDDDNGQRIRLRLTLPAGSSATPPTFELVGWTHEGITNE